MNPEKAFEFTTKSRYGDVQASNFFASGFIIFLLIIGLLIAAASWLSLYFIDSSRFVETYFSEILGLAILSSSCAGLASLLFAYGATYFPFKSPPKTVQHLLEEGGNVAEAATFATVRLLGPKANNPTPQNLAEVFEVLLYSPQGQTLLKRLHISPEAITTAVTTQILPELTWAALGEHALKVAASMQQPHLDTFHVLAVFLLHPHLRDEFRKLEYTETDLAFVIWWQIAAHAARQQKARWWTKQQLLDFTGIGLSWASGYTPFVDQFSRLPEGNPWDLPLGHEAQVEELITSLARQRQSNVLVVGQPGSARLGVIKEMARRVNSNQAHAVLNGQRVLYLHIGQLVGLAGSGPEQMSIVSQALREMEWAGNVIAVLDGLSIILGAGGQNSANMSDVIVPFFSSNKVRAVAIMSPDDYHLRFKGNPELLEVFEVVQVEPLTSEQTLQLLALTAEAWEKRTQIFLPYATLRAVVRNTENILPEIPFPEKAFDVLEEALVMVQKGKQEILSPNQITDIISRKIGFNVGKLSQSEKSHLLNLEEFIHKRVVNQEQAVAAVSNAMIRARAGVSSGKRPIGSFLFLGPTGVGKTETSKALAEAYFGSEAYLQRLDMSEYQGPDAIGRLIGTARAPSGTLTSLISDYPFTVLLLDEFEKADRNVHLLFLQVLDEGHLTDVRHRRFSFNNAIIIATSNAGAEFIRRSVSEAGTFPENFDAELREHILRQDLFRPELLNRFDGVVTFAPLSKEHIRKIASLMLRKLNKRLDEQHGLTVKISDDLIDFLIEIGYNPEFGARPMARAIQNTVELIVAQKILRGEVEPGQELMLHSSQLKQVKVPREN